MAAAKAGGTVKTVKAAPARGGFGVGLVVGLLIGLAVALGVALYITKAPIPFVNKLPQRTAEQDAAEAERNKHWDPNAPLAGKGAAPRAAAASGASAPDAPAPAPAATPAPAPVATSPAPGTAPAAPTGAQAHSPAAPASAATVRAPAAASAPARDPAAILAGQNGTTPAAKPAMFFVQAGAYSNPDDAEAQRARLAMSGFTAKVMAREQSGKTVYRVRLGPFDERDAADDLRDKLGAAGVESTLVRVER